MLYIFDARSAIAATANMAAGKGTENAASYESTELIFCNIGNIHVMRNSFVLLGRLLVMRLTLCCVFTCRTVVQELSDCV